MKEVIKVEVNEDTHVDVTASEGVTVERVLEVLSKTVDGLMPLYEANPEMKFKGVDRD